MAITSIQIAVTAGMHPRRGKAQQRCTSQIRHGQASTARLRKRGRVLVGKSRWGRRVVIVGDGDIELSVAIGHDNLDLVPDHVIGYVILDVVLSVLGDDLRDCVSVGIGFVVLNAKGNATVGVVRRRLEHPAFVILKLKRELPLLECPTFELFLCLDSGSSR